MSINKIRKGNRSELKARKILEAQGWKVEKARLSRGLWDLLAIKDNFIRHIQVKSNRGPCVEEWKRIFAAPVPGPHTKEVWIFYDRKPDPVILEVR